MRRAELLGMCSKLAEVCIGEIGDRLACAEVIS
jgi:hypothetical protein